MYCKCLNMNITSCTANVGCASKVKDKETVDKD